MPHLFRSLAVMGYPMLCMSARSALMPKSREAERPSTRSRSNLLAIAGIIEVDTPFDPGEETLQSPKSNVFPSSPLPVRAIWPWLKLFKARRQRKAGTLHHKRVVETDAIRVEPANAPFLFIAHSEIGEVLQRMQFGVPVIALVDHRILVVFPSVLAQEPFQTSAVIRISDDEIRVHVDRSYVGCEVILNIAAPHVIAAKAT